ncbi:lipoprotein insertase outer membrane protein LolB [Herbaspirillum sp. RV1423]|uniref:lipoprotein insertase outer membrane protein LolB n=1 Tax=Herbaspirillum sp. RV1423 TaxID=1443993 RepID=UPI000553DBB6|nr:lipoprotein insertase outer membrane protein LolB [Herbaspirillum sp. RV1423]
MTIEFIRRSAAACLVMLAAGCASIAPQENTGNAPAAERRYSDAIDLGGRLSVRYQRDDRDEALHGSFTWNQTERRVTVTLLSPLGQTLAVIDIKPGIAVLTQSGKPPMTAADVDILTEQALGWPLPVSGLRDWLQGFGRGADGKSFVARPSRDTERFITRDGWSLSYGEWQDEAADTAQSHPKRIDLARNTQQAGPVSIRIVIDNWQSH